MWNTPEGIRVLTTSEWKVFALGLDMLVGLLDEMIDSGDESEITSTQAFESMTHLQKLCTLAQVADALQDPDQSPPDLYAYNEATVSAVFEMLKGAVQDEIVCDDDKSLRTVIWDAIDLEVREEMDTKDMDAVTESEWYSLIDGFEEEILWDGDYDMEDLIMDLPAEQANAIKEQLTISEDYFTAIPPEPTPAMLESARSTLRRLLQATSD